MRKKHLAGARRIALWTLMTLMLVGALPLDGVTGGLIGDSQSLWASATALSLTLITVLSSNQK